MKPHNTAPHSLFWTVRYKQPSGRSVRRHFPTFDLAAEFAIKRFPDLKMWSPYTAGREWKYQVGGITACRLLAKKDDFELGHIYERQKHLRGPGKMIAINKALNIPLETDWEWIIDYLKTPDDLVKAIKIEQLRQKHDSILSTGRP